MAGRSCALSRRLTPGLSSRQLPMAGSPCSTWPKAAWPASRLRQPAVMATILSGYLLIRSMSALHLFRGATRRDGGELLHRLQPAAQSLQYAAPPPPPYPALVAPPP